MRTLAALMASITLLTTALFAHALASAGDRPTPVVAPAVHDQASLMDARERYDELVDDLCARRDNVELSQMMGMPCVKRNGKMVAGFTRGAMVFKLPDPEAHGRALALDGAHLFDPSGKGQPFKEWVVVPEAHASAWEAYAHEALGAK